MKTDSFINRFFREYPGTFFTLIGEDEQKATRYKFTTVEVKEQAFRFDGVFLPKTREDPIHFLESQFRYEDDFYARFFAEIFVYLRQCQPTNNWRAAVLFPNKAADPGVHHHYQEFFESGRLQRIYLTDLLKAHPQKFPLNLLQIILDSKQSALTTVKKIVWQLPSEVPDTKEQEKILQLLVNLLMNKFPKLPLEEITKMVEPFLSDIKKSRAYQDIAEEVAQELTTKIAIAKAREIAKSLLRKKMSVDLIAEVTGLSKKEVRALNKALAGRKN